MEKIYRGISLLLSVIMILTTAFSVKCRADTDILEIPDFSGTDKMDNLENTYSHSEGLTVSPWFTNTIMAPWGEDVYENGNIIYPYVSYKVKVGSIIKFDVYTLNNFSDNRFKIYQSSDGAVWENITYTDSAEVMAGNTDWVQVTYISQATEKAFIKIEFPDTKWNGTAYMLDNVMVYPKDSAALKGLDSYYSKEITLSEKIAFTSGNIVKDNISWNDGLYDCLYTDTSTEVYENGTRLTGYIAYGTDSTDDVEFTVYQYNDSGIAFDWNIQVSKDGYKWTDIAFETKSCGVLKKLNGEERTGINVYKLRVFETGGNYIRIIFPSNGWANALHAVTAIPHNSEKITANDNAEYFASTDKLDNLSLCFAHSYNLRLQSGLLQNNQNIVYVSDFDDSTRKSGWIVYKIPSGSEVSFDTMYKYDANFDNLNDYRLYSSNDCKEWTNVSIKEINSQYDGEYWNTSTFSAGNIYAEYIKICLPESYFSWEAMIDSVTVSSGGDYGDTNEDTYINIKDIVRIKKYISDNNKISINKRNADVVIDNTINSSDIVSLKKYLLGLEEPGTLFVRDKIMMQQNKSNTNSEIINIDTNNTVNNSFGGYGIEFDPYIWVDLSKERWEQIKLWLSWANLGTIRTMTNAYLFCLGFDENNEPVYVWDCIDENGNQLKDKNGDFVDKNGNVINHNVKATERLCEVLEFCQQNGVDAIIGDWSYPACGGNIYPGADYLQGVANNIGYTDGRWQKILAGFTARMYEKYPAAVKYLDQGNEVNLSPDAYNSKDWAESIKVLYRELEKKGIADKVKIVGPDGGFTNDIWLDDTLDNLADEVSDIDYHYYFNKSTTANGFLENNMRVLKNTITAKYPDKKLMITEMGYSALQNAATINESFGDGFDEAFVATSVADAMLQFTRAGVDTSLLWMVDDATHVAWGKLPTDYKTEADTIWKYGGLWNSNGTQAGYPEQENPRPMYYTWATLSRAFPKNSVIVSTNNPDNKAARTLASIFESDKGTEISFALVNSSEEPITVTVQCDKIANKVDLMYYEYTDGSIPMTDKLCPKEKSIIRNANLKSGVEITIPSSGTAVLTTKDTDSTVIISSQSKGISDDMSGFTNMYSHSSNLGCNGFKAVPELIAGDIDDNRADYNGDNSRIHRSDDSEAYIIYKLNNTKSFKVGFYRKNKGNIRVLVSGDGTVFREKEMTSSLTTCVSGNIYYEILSCENLDDGVGYIKIILTADGEFDDLQLTYFEASTNSSQALKLLGSAEKKVYVKPNEIFSLNKITKIRFTGGYVGDYAVAWDDVHSFQDKGTHYVHGNISGTAISVYAEVYVTEEIHDEFDDYSIMYETPYNLVQNGVAQSTFNGDLTQLHRIASGEGIIKYRFFGATEVISDIFLYNVNDNPADYVKIYASGDGNNYTEVSADLVERKENDSKGVYGIGNTPRYVLTDEQIQNNYIYWPMYTIKSGKLPDNTAYIKIVITDNENIWLQQIKAVTIR